MNKVGLDLIQQSLHLKKKKILLFFLIASKMTNFLFSNIFVSAFYLTTDMFNSQD